MSKTNKHVERPFPFLVPMAIIAAAIGLLVFAGLAFFVLTGKTDEWDLDVGMWVRSLDESMTPLFMTATWAGNPEFVAPALLVVFILLLVRKHKLEAILLVIAVLGGWGLDEGLKALFQRERPDAMSPLMINAEGYAFPSGHAMVSWYFYGFVAYLSMLSLYKRKKSVWVLVGIFWIVLMLLVGTSRVYFEVHYPSDILAGYGVGMFWTMAIILFHQQNGFSRNYLV